MQWLKPAVLQYVRERCVMGEPKRYTRGKQDYDDGDDDGQTLEE